MDYTVVVPAISQHEEVISSVYAGEVPFLDRLSFVTDGTDIHCEAIGFSRHWPVNSGRAHMSYTMSLKIDSATIQDADGNVLASLTNAPFWALPKCNLGDTNCSPHQTDSWSGTFSLPAGITYFLVLAGSVQHNIGQGVSYTYSIFQVVPPA